MMPEPLPHPDWLRAFSAFADTGNFTRAAERLGLTQPAVFGQVKKLSAWAGVPLYRREGRALVLTAEGRLMRAFAAELLSHCDHFRALLQGDATADKVTLAAGEGAHLYLLGPVTREFAGHLKIRVAAGDETLRLVAMGEAQVGVIAGAAPPEALESQVIQQVGQQLIVPQSAPIASAELISPADLHGASLIVPPAHRPHRIALEVTLSEVEWRVAVEAPSWPVTLRLIELGMGWAVVNDCVPPPDGCVAIPLPAMPSVRYWAIRRRGGLHGPAAQRLWSALSALEELSAH